MVNWQKIEAYHSNPLIQEGNRAAIEISDAMVEEARGLNLDLLEQFRLYDIRPQEFDVTFAILDRSKKPVGFAKLCLRPSRPEMTGYLAIWIYLPGPQTRSSRRLIKEMHAEAIFGLSKIAREQFDILEVWTHASPNNVYLTRALKEAGFKERKLQKPIGATEVRYLEYFKRLD